MSCRVAETGYFPRPGGSDEYHIRYGRSPTDTLLLARLSPAFLMKWRGCRRLKHFPCPPTDVSVASNEQREIRHTSGADNLTEPNVGSLRDAYTQGRLVRGRARDRALEVLHRVGGYHTALQSMPLVRKMAQMARGTRIPPRIEC